MIDLLLGGLHGVAIGDALGAPFEFTRSTPKIKYDGILTDVTVKVHFKYAAMTIHPGSITDDTEMTIQLLKSILKNKKYIVDDVIKSYLDWANLKQTPLGKNTRKLMKGVTQVKNFRKRQEKFDTSDVESNGSLMRCFPLLLVSVKENFDTMIKFSDIDVTLTNDNDVNRECSRIYLTIAYYLLHQNFKEFVINNDIIRKKIQSAINYEILDVEENKGWVIHALYVSIITLLHTSSFQNGMDFIAKHFIKGDTDTIMAISGGLLGLKYGYTEMCKEKKTSENIDRLYSYFNTQNERPTFTPNLLNELIKFVG